MYHILIGDIFFPSPFQAIGHQESYAILAPLTPESLPEITVECSNDACDPSTGAVVQVDVYHITNPSISPEQIFNALTQSHEIKDGLIYTCAPLNWCSIKEKVYF